MKLVLALAGLLAGSSAASAQFMAGPGYPVYDGAQDAAEIAQAVGLDPIGPAARSGPYFVLRARDDYGRVVRVTVDARRSQIVAVEGGMRGFYGPPAGYGAPRAYPGYHPYPRGDVALAPPGSVMGTPSQPQPHVMPMPAQPRTAAPHPARPAKTKTASAPVPRKRPAAAPQEAAGSVEPIKPETKPADPATPPVAPLE